MSGRPDPPELVLSAAWHGGAIPATLHTVDGQPLEVIHRGTWSHGLGPDFNDALILVDGHELRAGSLEMHLRTRGWHEHGHHLDPAYNTVILHVVGSHDGSETRRQDGALIPTIDVGPLDQFIVPEFVQWDWSRVGGRSCAEQLARHTPQTLRESLYRLGDIRLAARSARIEARLPIEQPGEILWSELLDGLGYSANRAPMRALAQAMPLAALEDLLQGSPRSDRGALALAILLGGAGFLPLAPAEAHLLGLTHGATEALDVTWRDKGDPWRPTALKPTAWQHARVRPANHPLLRLRAAANLLAAASGDAGVVAAMLRTLTDGPDPVAALRALTGSQESPGIGLDRAADIVASVSIPFALALAAHSGDWRLADAASERWERLPAPASNAVTRRAAQQVAGSARLGKIGARGAQGLIHLDTTLCQPRRCFECPIAAAELAVNG